MRIENLLFYFYLETINLISFVLALKYLKAQDRKENPFRTSFIRIFFFQKMWNFKKNNVTYKHVKEFIESDNNVALLIIGEPGVSLPLHF